MKKWILSIAMISFLLPSCGAKKEVDQIGDAQLCLDKLGASPAAADVNECLSKVADLSSPAAETIRCSGGFMKEGFASGKRFIDAFSAINGGTTNSSTQALMGILTFTSANTLTTDTSNARSAFTSCLASGGKGSTLLASFSYLTMGLVSFFNAKGAGTCPTTPTTAAGGYKFYDISTCISTCSVACAIGSASLIDANTADVTSATTQSALGAVIIATYNASCTGSTANQDLCGTFSTAVSGAGGDPRKVATQFFSSVLGIQ